MPPLSKNRKSITIDRKLAMTGKTERRKEREGER
jgi:hypothetical protein